MTDEHQAEFIALMKRERMVTATRLAALDNLLASYGVTSASAPPFIVKMPDLNEAELHDLLHNARPGAILPKQKPTSGVRRRFTDLKELHPETVNGLAIDHPAVIEGRTLFPSTVIDPTDSPRLLISGANNRKLGDRIVKGPWKGMPLYHLTLEERATCSDSCFLWTQCYGNGMQMARRHSTNGIEQILEVELAELDEQHESGFVVRLHTLGDFFSTDYVAFWARMLNQFHGLHVYGYTHRPKDEPIGAAIWNLTSARWDRFAIRWSDKDGGPGNTTTIFRKPEAAVVPEGIVCPAETGKTECCGTCGLCWNEAARDKTIVFIAHGPHFKDKTEATPAAKSRVGRKSHEHTRDVILDAIRTLHAQGKRISGSTLQQATGYSGVTGIATLHEFARENIIDRIGTGPGTKWRLPTLASAEREPLIPTEPIPPLAPAEPADEADEELDEDYEGDAASAALDAFMSRKPEVQETQSQRRGAIQANDALDPVIKYLEGEGCRVESSAYVGMIKLDGEDLTINQIVRNANNRRIRNRQPPFTFDEGRAGAYGSSAAQVVREA